MLNPRPKRLSVCAANAQRWGITDVARTARVTCSAICCDDTLHVTAHGCPNASGEVTEQLQLLADVLEGRYAVCVRCQVIINPFAVGAATGDPPELRLVRSLYDTHLLVEQLADLVADRENPPSVKDVTGILDRARQLWNLLRSSDYPDGVDDALTTAAALVDSIEATACQVLTWAPLRSELLDQMYKAVVPAHLRTHVELDMTDSLIAISPAAQGGSDLPVVYAFRAPGLPADYETGRDATLLRCPAFVRDYLLQELQSPTQVFVRRFVQCVPAGDATDETVTQLADLWDPTGVTAMVNLSTALHALRLADAA